MKQRDSARTRAAILAAAKDLLAEQGFANWGINGIARAAGCDKQLIYRYFGGLDGLAEAIGEDVARWLEEALAANPATPATSYAELMARLAVALLDALRGNRLAQRIIAWELAEPSPLAASFSAARGKALAGWVARERGALRRPAGVDAPMINALLVAGVQQLVLADASGGRFMGIDLGDDAGWERVRAAIAAMTRAIYGG
ncbi:TetR/AcrR family transcriptional regulator [Sphingomonas sp. JC676]|uniref:TetR/AcrR family transcriptional regulator n=1 Tax=Sphingomonas sp. JC676 TaxID=2768065 RepID=UPI00292A5813|nr:TetR/AcrR family transcriptional regulator [Sphingomonas sp. JC676]